MSSERRFVYWMAGLALFFAAVFVLRGILLPFVLGMAVAYFLDPAADYLGRLGLSRALSATVLTILFLLFGVVVVLLLAPLLQSQILALAARAPDLAELLRHRVEDVLAMVQARLSPEDLERLRAMLANLAGSAVSWIGKLISGLWSGGLALVNLISLAVITPVVTFYLLRDWDKLVAKLDQWLPRDHAGTIRAQMALIDGTLAAFARGQAIVCALLGAFYGIGLSLVGLEFGLIVGLTTGLISFVPYFGMLVGFVVGIGLAVAQFDSLTPVALVAAVFVAGQVIEGNIVSPKLVGDRVGLHPVWMIFALMAGGALFGFMGVLLAVPVAATIGVLSRFALGRYLAGPLYGGDGDGGGAADE
ncbi:MAG: AI-2E family transporter [Alphaproteobacteria bacterium]